ncbi:hypothetical protein LTS18_014371 [Coniosporium uncinatum]|uniref:Uncharacterized protein n=1 Tax=Coniosporium uncinatum TaxID=93489 RepID=A0ACC3DVI9_9PEZI|nr:hypothetical protein LTS18_014371 [Coniosporium uncinatum]
MFTPDSKKILQAIVTIPRAPETAPIDPQQTEAGVEEMVRLIKGKGSVALCHFLCTRSNGQLRAIDYRYDSKYQANSNKYLPQNQGKRGNQDLDTLIKKHYSGYEELAFCLMLARAVDPARADADQLEGSMKGVGTKDTVLLATVVRAHWDKDHMNQVCRAYNRFYGKPAKPGEVEGDLYDAISGETSGDFRKVLLRCVEPSYYDAKGTAKHRKRFGF